MSDDLRAALSDLVQSHGWQAIKAHAVRTWGNRVTLERIAQQRHGDVDEMGRAALTALAEHHAIDELLNWPDAEIARLEKAVERDQSA